jgi:hypothetical protein
MTCGLAMKVLPNRCCNLCKFHTVLGIYGPSKGQHACRLVLDRQFGVLVLHLRSTSPKVDASEIVASTDRCKKVSGDVQAV